MSSGHCAHCGAMSTIWLPTCVFCGNSLTDPPTAGRQERTRRVFQLALADTPSAGTPGRKCTSRVFRARAPGFLEVLRSLWTRMFQSFVAIRR